MLPVVIVAVPAVDKLPTVAVPVVFKVPVTLIPVEVMITVLATLLTLNKILPLFKIEIFDEPLDSVPGVTVAQLKLPTPSVLRYCPELPPNIFTFATLPKLAVVLATKLLDVTLPLASIITEVGNSPIEYPATEFKGLIAILSHSYFIIFINICYGASTITSIL